jgi:hypothetical protein
MPTRQTKAGIPVVSKVTLEAFSERYTKTKNNDWGDLLSDAQKRMVDENPYLVKHIEAQVGMFPKEAHNAILAVIVGVYKLLEHQAQINKEIEINEE